VDLYLCVLCPRSLNACSIHTGRSSSLGVSRRTESLHPSFGLTTSDHLFSIPQLSVTAKMKREYLVILPDKSGRLDARLKVRPQHVADIGVTSQPRSDGPYLASAGGLALDFPSTDQTPHFNGSALSVVAESKEQALEFLKKDVYAENDVWDFENAQVYAVSNLPNKMLFTC
jgi:hypothetical protein